MNKLIIKSIVALTASFVLSTGTVAQEHSLEDIVRMVAASAKADSAESKKRIAEFNSQKSQQQSLLSRSRAEFVHQERIGQNLKKQFNANELKIAEKEKQLDKRLGSLKELFGHLTGFVGDVRETIDGSLVSAQYPGRTDFMSDMIEKMSGTTELPSIEDIHKAWEVTVSQINEGGKVVSFTAAVDNNESQSVVRLGNYNLVSDGNYLTYDAGTKRTSTLARQPAGQASDVVALESAMSGMVSMGIDPTGPSGGSLLAALVDQPSWAERLWTQGGEVGYMLMILLAVAVLIAIYKFIQITVISGKIKSQLSSDNANTNNPLGRIMAVHQSSPDVDTETLELKLNEAILKERPPIEGFLNALKIIAAVGPLLGLLGTVTGMILTFQGIALYGAGDVGAMAGGISQALMTTVWGLIVAIPTILMHTLVNGRAMNLIHILDEQAAGIVAQKAEG